LGHVDRETGYPASEAGCLVGSDPDWDELLREQGGDSVDALRNDRDVPPSTEGGRGRFGRPEQGGDFHASLDEEDGLPAGSIDELNAQRGQVRGEQSLDLLWLAGILEQQESLIRADHLEVRLDVARRV